MGRSAVLRRKEPGGRLWHLGPRGEGTMGAAARASYLEGEGTGSPDALLLMKGGVEFSAQILPPPPCLELLPITSSSGQFPLRVPRLVFSAFWFTSIQLPLFSWWMLSNLCTMTSSITHTVFLTQWLPSCHRKGFWLQRT